MSQKYDERSLIVCNYTTHSVISVLTLLTSEAITINNYVLNIIPKVRDSNHNSILG